LRWLSYEKQKPIRARLKVSYTYIADLQQEIESNTAMTIIAVCVLVRQLVPRERKRMWGNVRAARSRQRKREEREPLNIAISKDTGRKLEYLRQKIDQYSEGISLDETIRYLIDAKADHNKL